MGGWFSRDVLESPTQTSDVGIMGLSYLLMSRICNGEAGPEINFLPVF